MAMTEDGEDIYWGPDDWGGATYDDLCQAVAEVRSRGVGNLDEPLLDLEPLLEVARLISQKDDDAARIEDALKRAVNELGGMSAEAVLALLGLTAETRGHNVKFRRKAAAEAYDYKSPESFRAHYEKQLLLATATRLFITAERQFIEEQRAMLLRRMEKLQDERAALIVQHQAFIKKRDQELARKVEQT
jgi:hypothetical protein